MGYLKDKKGAYALYPCQLLWSYKAKYIRKLTVTYNDVFILLRDCSASYMFVSQGLASGKMLIRKMMYT